MVADPLGAAPGQMEVRAPSAQAALRSVVKIPNAELRGALFAALSASESDWGLARKNLIFTLLEDGSCQLSALHAEVLLRWRLSSSDVSSKEGPSTIQPTLLKAALAEDAASGRPVIAACEPVSSLHNQPGPATPTTHSSSRPPATAWGECVIQLQVQLLAALLSVPMGADLPSVPPGMAGEGALPSFLFEYETPVSQARGLEPCSVLPSRTTTFGEEDLSPVSGQEQRDALDGASSLPPVTPNLHRNSAPSSASGHSGPLFSPSSLNNPTNEVPAEVATCWGAAGMSSLTSPTIRGSTSQPLLPGAFYGGSRSYGGGLAQSPEPSIGPESRHTVSGTISEAKRIAVGPQQGGLRAAMAGCTGAPPPSPASGSPYQPLTSPTMSLPPLPERRTSNGRDVPGGIMWPHHTGYSNSQLPTLDGGLLSCDGLPPGSLPASSYGGSSFQPNWMTQPYMANPLAPQRSLGGQPSPHGNSPSAAMFMVGHPSTPFDSSMGPGTNGTGMGSPPSNGLGAQRESGDSVCQPPSVCSAISDENGVEDSGSPGEGTISNMDLETALEAIINFESGADGSTGAGTVSAATAAAAHNSLQQHVAAAVRAAAVRAAATGSGSGDGGVGALSMSFAAVARLSADGGGGAGMGGGPLGGHGGSSGLVGSAPSSTMAAYLQSQADAQAIRSAAAGPYNRLTIDPSSSMFMDEQQRATADAVAATAAGAVAAARCAAGASPGGMSSVSLSAPRPTAGWASVAARHPSTPTNKQQPAASPTAAAGLSVKSPLDTVGGVPTVGMLASSSSGARNPAMAAAAAMAVAVQQQQAAAASGLLTNRSINALVAAAQQQQQQQQGGPIRSTTLDLGNLPMLHAAAASNVLGTRLWTRLPSKLRADVQQVLASLPGIKPEELEDNVLYQLMLSQKLLGDDAASALRGLPDFTSGLHMTAYLPHDSSFPLSPPARGSGSLPTSSKAILQKLPSRVLARLEEVVARCSYMDWKHFDAGVVKVMGQLSELSEADVLEELQLLEATDLSNVEYMPAYLNKRLNNRLWSRRKAQQQQAQGLH